MISSEKMNWYFNRLRSMPKAEVLHRAKEAVQQRRSFVPDSSAASSIGLKKQTTNPQLVRVWSTFWTQKVEQECLRQAKALNQGTISVFGHEWSALLKQWHVDPATGYVWPSVSVNKIDYRHSATPDPKPIWEVNRLLFLIPLAIAIDSGKYERRSGETLVEALITDWIHHCRPGQGPMWAASIEVAIRSISLTFAVQAMKTPSTEFLTLVGRSVRDHAEWIKRFPSAYSSANNHRVAEISALLVLEASWTGILTMSERKRLENELQAVVRSLFSQDGVGLEQSPTYAGFSIEFLRLVLYCYDWTEPGCKTAVQGIVDEASATLIQFTKPDGSLIRYGDDDEGKVLTVVVPDDEYAWSLAVLGGGDLAQRNSGLLTFAEGGISLLRFEDSGVETTWALDHGPLGFGNIAAHGHADTLSVSMTSDNVDWIVDAGTYRYHGDKKWRTYFRSSRAHNAPQLDGVDSSVMTGDFNWDPVKRASGRLINSWSNGQTAKLRVAHDGYVLQGGGSITRTLERTEEGHYRVIDEHESTSQLSSAFMIHPDCRVVETASGWLLTHTHSKMRVEIKVTGAETTFIECPDEETAWFSPRFGTKVPTWRLGAIASSENRAPLSFDFVIFGNNE